MIYFSDFAAAAAATRTIATIPIVTSGSGTKNFTSSSLGGLTPAGALIIGAHHLTANDPGETPNVSFSMGSIAGSASNVVVLWSEDNQASTSTWRSGRTTAPHMTRSNVIDVDSTSGATITDGFSIVYGGATTAVTRSMGIAFAGAGTSAKNGIVPLGTGTSAISVTGVGFQPDAIILYGNCDDIGPQASVIQYTFGVATSDGTQRCVMARETNNRPAGEPFMALFNDCAGGEKLSSALQSKLTVGGFNSDGFTITPSSSQNSDEVAYLALKFTGQSVKIVDFTTPTSTGAQAITGAGFTPQAAIVVLTNLEAVNTAEASTSDLQGGFAISFLTDVSYSVSTRIDSGADPTDTGTQCGTGLMGPSATDCDAIKATLTSFDSDGMTLNYSAVQGTGKKGFILFIQ